MGLWPGCARAGAECPGRVPDVRGSGRMSDHLMAVASVLVAGFPGGVLDVQALLSCQMSGVSAGCPATDALVRLLV